MDEKNRWAAIGFMAMFLYGIAIFTLGPLARLYLNPPDQMTATPFSIFLLGLETGIIGSAFFLMLYWFYRRRSLFAIYAGIIFIALVLVLSLIDRTARGDKLITIFLTYYLPGSLISTPLQPIIPGPSNFCFIVVTFSWVIWGLLGVILGYLSDKLCQLIKNKVLNWRGILNEN